MISVDLHAPILKGILDVDILEQILLGNEVVGYCIITDQPLRILHTAAKNTGDGAPRPLAHTCHPSIWEADVVSGIPVPRVVLQAAAVMLEMPDQRSAELLSLFNLDAL